MTTETDETMSPETAVTGATYWWHTTGTSTRLQWAPWVTRQTAVAAGARKELVWGLRIDLINEHLGCKDLDAIAEATGGEIEISQDATGRGGRLTLAGVMAAVELAESRAAAKTEAARTVVSGMAEIAAACEIEGTPLAPVAAYTRSARRCTECGSLVYGDHCTHCHES